MIQFYDRGTTPPPSSSLIILVFSENSVFEEGRGGGQKQGKACSHRVSAIYLKICEQVLFSNPLLNNVKFSDTFSHSFLIEKTIWNRKMFSILSPVMDGSRYKRSWLRGDRLSIFLAMSRTKIRFKIRKFVFSDRSSTSTIK